MLVNVLALEVHMLYNICLEGFILNIEHFSEILIFARFLPLAENVQTFYYII